MARSWPTITFLTSKSACSSSSAASAGSADGGSATGCRTSGPPGQGPGGRARHGRPEASVRRADRRPAGAATASPAASRRYRSRPCALLVVEDEVDLADALAAGPAARGLRGRRRQRRRRAPSSGWRSTAYDLVCLDLNLPDIDGLEVCRRLRTDPALRARPTRPAPRVLMLTARDASTTGSPASTTAPTTTWSSRSPSPSWRPGCARCCAATPAAPAPCSRSATLRLDTARFEAWRGDRAARPHGQGVRPAALLHEPTPARSSRQEHLLEHVWDEHADPFTNTVRVTVGTLRRKLPSDDEDAADRDGRGPGLPAPDRAGRRGEPPGDRRRGERAGASDRPSSRMPTPACERVGPPPARLDGLDPVPAHRPLLALPVRAGRDRGRRASTWPSPRARRRAGVAADRAVGRRAAPDGTDDARARSQASDPGRSSSGSTSGRSQLLRSYSLRGPRAAVPRQPRRRLVRRRPGARARSTASPASPATSRPPTFAPHRPRGPPDELKDLADTFDGMLGRLDERLREPAPVHPGGVARAAQPAGGDPHQPRRRPRRPRRQRRGPAPRPPRWSTGRPRACRAWSTTC